MRQKRLLLAAILTAAASASAQTVTLNGSMGTRQALLVIDGVPRVVGVGATVQGVRLLSLSATQAEVDVGGQRRLLLAGASQVRLGAADERGTGSGAEIVLTAGSGGHFTTAGQINGKAVTFMVDTGATAIALGQADADRIGLNYKNAPRGFAGTANGRIPVNVVTLSSVRVGDVEVANVEAVVMPSTMQHILLGNSFLTRFQMKRDNDTMRLTLR
ncbi:MAG TPA: TIGR02281 family clan AA aspartic protease [Burkholderiaceae bacterium]